MVAASAAVFWWTFEFAKHDPVLRSIIPFGEDPYDSVSSFAVIASTLLALVSLVRSFFPQWVGRSGRRIYVLRAQAAVSFCILVTVAAEIVAMARHSSMWSGRPGSGELLILEAGLAVVAAVTLIMTRVEISESRASFARAAVIWSAMLLALALYPERMILGTPGHLFTVVVGTVFLFAPVAMSVKAWLPVAASTTRSDLVLRKRIPRGRTFAVAAAIGAVVGVSAFLGEVSEGSTELAVNKMLFVASVFIGLGAVGIIIGYTFLGRLLGFSIEDQYAAGPKPSA